MAKRIITLCVFFCMLLCGCAGHGGSQGEVCADFQADFTAAYNGLNFGGTLLHTRQGNTDLRFTRPETLRDLELAYQNGELRLSRMQAACTADEGYLPDISFPSMLRQVLKGMADGRAQLVKEEDDSRIYTLQTSHGSCEIKTNAEGLPQALALQHPKLLVEFEGTREIG